jgi:Uma2 family endonuclease
VVLTSDLSSFSHRRPGPGDLDLVIEVAESTLGFDLKTKAGLYARAAIGEYWVLDITGRQMIVHRDPRDGH